MAQTTIREITDFLQQGFAVIIKFLKIVWAWSFGQIVAIFQSDWQALPAWKIILLVLIIGGIAYLLYRSAVDIWSAVLDIFSAFVALLSAFVTVLPYVLGAGLIAFAGGWIIQNVNF